MKKSKKYHLYVLYDVSSCNPVYVGLSCSLRNRIYKHEKSKEFDGVIIIESFCNKNDGLIAERCLIKFLSIFQLESVVNGLYARYDNMIKVDNVITNKLKDIKNGRLD
jgi:predicted GIY-YIG superfamily endonuclease